MIIFSSSKNLKEMPVISKKHKNTTKLVIPLWFEVFYRIYFVNTDPVYLVKHNFDLTSH